MLLLELEMYIFLPFQIVQYLFKILVSIINVIKGTVKKNIVVDKVHCQFVTPLPPLVDYASFKGDES